ncbi:MAG: hypothetical protein ACOH2K_01150 [Burkholderiaceae bacterium]
MHTYIKTTETGLKVEVIGRAVCLDGKIEAETLIALIEHPNRDAILRAVPNATHMAGRIPLTLFEAGTAKSALFRAINDFDPNPKAIMERLRLNVIEKAKMEGIE